MATIPDQAPREERRHAVKRDVVPYTQIHQYVRRTLETVQDLAVILLLVFLTALTMQALWRLGKMAFLDQAPSSVVLSQIVFVLILTELYRTLIFYLREHRVSVALMLEVAIVSTLQELILRGGRMEHEVSRVLSDALLLVVFGGLLALQRWLGQSRHEVAETSAH